MNSKRRLALVAMTLFGLIAVRSALAQDKAWVGQSVLHTKPASQIKFGDRVGDKQEFFPFSGRWPFVVREEKEGWLRLFDGRREGWVDKADFVLASESFAYFDGRVRANPKDTFALTLRGGYWMGKKDYDKAIEDFNGCLRVNPNDAVSYHNRGTAWAAKKDFDKAIADYTESLRINPKSANTLTTRGLAWRNQKEWDKAIDDYTEAVRLEPNYAIAWHGRALAWNAKKEYDKAIDDFDKAIKLDPKYAVAFNDRGLAWVAKKDYAKGIKDYDEAIRLNSKSAVIFTNRAFARKLTKDYAKAIADNEAAIRLDPKYARAYTNLGWILATCPDDQHRNGKRAVEVATRACQLSNFKDPVHLDVLAAAYAEAGQFDQAVRYEMQALESATFAKTSGVAARKRLKLYEEKKAFRE